jgi:hypothetical protein
VAGDDKRDLLARAKVLLNVHGEDEPYFEWLRVAEGICAGCAVVSERSSDIAPLESGRHLLTGELGSLGLFCAWLVEDASKRERMRRDAYQLLLRQRPLSDSARQLVAAGREADATPISQHLLLAAKQERARGQFRERPPSFERQPLDRSDLSDGEALVLRSLKQQMLATMALRRQLAGIEYSLRNDHGDEPQTRGVAESAGWTAGPTRALTVIIPLFNHRDEVLAALGSLERSSLADWEAVIVDDASSDGGGATVQAWIEARPRMACLLVRNDLNRGLAAARNAGAERARTDRLLMLDADNEVRPTALARLMRALDADPEASFAYGIMERFSSQGAEGLVSAYGWDPERLRSTNYIDAFSLIRREAFVALDGYSYDQRLYGWEDYDLWVRMAEAGRYGVFVPEIIARYRVGHSSMISQTNISTSDAYAALLEHAPKLLSGVRIPR